MSNTVPFQQALESVSSLDTPQPATEATAATPESNEKGRKDQGGQPTKRRVTHYADDEVLVEVFRRKDGRLCVARRDRSSGKITEGERAIIRGYLYEPLVDPLTTGGSVILPPPPHAEAQDTKRLFDDLSAFVAEHVTLSPEFHVGAVAFIMATWVYERFPFFPYLQFIGPPGSGKTRALEVLEAVCYHSFKQSSPTPAVIYRVVSRCHPTLIVDEQDAAMHRDLRAILREGSNRGGKVVRCRQDDYDPQPFDCYGPKIYAGQEPITDAALASRIIQENMAHVSPDPKIGPALPESFEQARDLRARLLRWALDNYWTIGARDPGGDDLRQRQVFSPLFTVTPPEYHDRLTALMDRQHSATRRTMADTLDGEVVATLRDKGLPEIIRPIEVARTVSQARGVDCDSDARNPERVSPEKVGHALKRLGIVERGRDKSGTFYRAKREALERLCRTYLPEPAPLEHERAMAVAPAESPILAGPTAAEEDQRRVSDLGDDEAVPLPDAEAV